MSMICQCDMCKEEAKPNVEFDQYKLIIYSPDRTNPFESNMLHLCMDCLPAVKESIGELTNLVGGKGMEKEKRG